MVVQTVPLRDPTAQLNLPPGFRFHPTDEELMVKYLLPKVAGHEFNRHIIGDVNLYKFDPWDLPSQATFGEKEWYFFSPRDRKYPNGSRPNRLAGSGYWKATGTDKVILSEGLKVGIKKALVFYIGKAPRGSKTNWIMHEYRLSEPSKPEHSSRLDDWVLCRIYKKNSSAEKTVSGGPSMTEQSLGSPSSPSSQFDGVLDSLPAINDEKFLNFPMKEMFGEEDQKVEIQKFETGGCDWLGMGGFGLQGLQDPNPNSGSMDPTFNMQMRFGKSEEEEVRNGIRSQRMENSGYLFSERFMNSTDPFAIRYPAQSSSSGYRG